MVALARYIFHKVCCNKADRPSNRVLLYFANYAHIVSIPYLMVSIRPAGFDPSQSLRNLACAESCRILGIFLIFFSPRTWAIITSKQAEILTIIEINIIIALLVLSEAWIQLLTLISRVIILCLPVAIVETSLLLTLTSVNLKNSCQNPNCRPRGQGCQRPVSRFSKSGVRAASYQQVQ